jgi:hypothetical protein
MIRPRLLYSRLPSQKAQAANSRHSSGSGFRDAAQQEQPAGWKGRRGCSGRGSCVQLRVIGERRARHVIRPVAVVGAGIVVAAGVVGAVSRHTAVIKVVVRRQWRKGAWRHPQSEPDKKSAPGLRLWPCFWTSLDLVWTSAGHRSCHEPVDFTGFGGPVWTFWTYLPTAFKKCCFALEACRSSSATHLSAPTGKYVQNVQTGP